jgi:translation initiation factor 2 alpha subunit (eIF-2alpha)
MKKRYTVTMDEALDRDVQEVAQQLGISQAEAFRRAMMLLKHASKAEHVILRDEAGKEKEVLIR